MEREVTLMEMLEAREARVRQQEALRERYGLPVISFTLNIAGPVKDSPLIRRGFRAGKKRLLEELDSAGLPVRHEEEILRHTGCEWILAVEGDALQIKAVCTAIEDENPLGRLFDMDVLTADGEKLDRSAVNGGPRNCIVCGAPGKGCASRRTHTVEELQQAARRILRRHFQDADSRAIGALAVRALLYEVCTTPKPGLVDGANCGSHRDMNLFTFVDSSAALAPYFQKAAALGQETAGLPPEETFRRLRPLGRRAEREMFAATGGVNTHKGAVFSLGTVCAALGRLWDPVRPVPAPEQALALCGRMSARAVEEDFAAIASHAPQTAGQRLFAEHGLRGIRGEVADGLPGVSQVGLPALNAALAAGAGLEQAGVSALIALIARVTDTNLAARGGLDGQSWAAERAGALLADGPIADRTAVEGLDQEMIRRNLSPGGCADLLAITYFLHLCGTEFPGD